MRIFSHRNEEDGIDESGRELSELSFPRLPRLSGAFARTTPSWQPYLLLLRSEWLCHSSATCVQLRLAEELGVVLIPAGACQPDVRRTCFQGLLRHGAAGRAQAVGTALLPVVVYFFDCGFRIGFPSKFNARTLIAQSISRVRHTSEPLRFGLISNDVTGNSDHVCRLWLPSWPLARLVCHKGQRRRNGVH